MRGSRHSQNTPTVVKDSVSQQLNICRRAEAEWATRLQIGNSIRAAVFIALCLFAVCFTTRTSSQAVKPGEMSPAKFEAANYVGSDACKDCHEDQFKAFSRTAHAQLSGMSSWKNHPTGCESCHGPGKDHIEAGDGSKIISFKGKAPKDISDTCLTCHAGKEERNNFRRGEHWRNDVGCTDCHAPHNPPGGANLANSNVFVAAKNAEKPGFASIRMLRMSDPQLCIGCHAEVRVQFQAPFHHKVFEGAMRCSDCHNPHGGFELKQSRLAIGADVPCLKCHVDKQGPFTFEHAPLKTEGCTACHIPHGSANPRLLKFSAVAQLCLTCHSAAHGVGAAEPAGPQHNQNAQYANCTACHVKIHGSRSSPVFFR